MKWRVLVTSPPMLLTIDLYSVWYKKHELEVALPRVARQMEEFQFLEMIEGFDIAIAGDVPFTISVHEKVKRLKSNRENGGLVLTPIELEVTKG